MKNKYIHKYMIYILAHVTAFFKRIGNHLHNKFKNLEFLWLNSFFCTLEIRVADPVGFEQKPDPTL